MILLTVTAHKNKLSFKYFFSKETADLLTFTKEILNGKRMCQMSSNDPVSLKILGNISPKPLSPVNWLGIQNFHLAAEKAIKWQIISWISGKNGANLNFSTKKVMYGLP